MALRDHGRGISEEPASGDRARVFASRSPIRNKVGVISMDQLLPFIMPLWRDTLGDRRCVGDRCFLSDAQPGSGCCGGSKTCLSETIQWGFVGVCWSRLPLVFCNTLFAVFSGFLACFAWLRACGSYSRAFARSSEGEEEMESTPESSGAMKAKELRRLRWEAIWRPLLARCRDGSPLAFRPPCGQGTGRGGRAARGGS